MKKPPAPPRRPAAARGVSTQRSAPKRSRSPAVARKTPPARPTSSPITSTFSSRSNSTWNASLTASTRVSSAKDPLQLRQIRRERRRRVDVGVREDQRRVGRGLGLGGCNPFAQYLCGIRPDGLDGRVREQPESAQVGLVAADALALLLLFHPLEIDVGGRIVGGRVRR